MSLYGNPNGIVVNNIEPTIRQVPKEKWCGNCRANKHRLCSGVRKELRNGKHPCECPTCRAKETG